MKKLSAFLVLFVLVCIGAVAEIIPNTGFESTYNPNGKFYRVTVRNKYMYGDGTNLRLTTTAPTTFDNTYLFQFVGNSESFQIYCKGTGTPYGVNNTNNSTRFTNNGTNRNLKVVPNSNGFCLASNPNVIINDVGNAGYLANWSTSNPSAVDGGSKFLLFGAEYHKQAALSVLAAFKTSLPSLETTYNEVNERLLSNNETEDIAFFEEKINNVIPQFQNTKLFIRGVGSNSGGFVGLDTNDGLVVNNQRTANATALNAFMLTNNKLRSVLTGWYVQRNGTADAQQVTNANGVNVTMAYRNGKFTFQPANPSGNQQVWHISGSNVLTLWTGDNVNSQFDILPCTLTEEDILSAAKQRIMLPTGTNFGDRERPTDNVQAALDGHNIDLVYNVYTSVKNGTGYSRVVPRQGDFIRIKNPANTTYPYVSVANTSATALTLQNTANISTVFYMYQDNKMVNIATGKAVGKNTNSGEWEVGNYGDEKTGKVNFKGDAPVGQLSVLGWENQRWLNASKTAATTGVSNNRIVNNNAWTSDFIIERVTEFTLPLSAQGLATFVVPAGKYINVSEGTKAYIIKSVNSTSARLTEVSEGIGKSDAPVAIFLRGSENGTATLTFTTEAGSNNFEGNLLKGVAQPSGDTKKTVTNDFTFNGVEFIPVATDLKYRPFRALLDGTLAAGVQSLALDFDNITSIEALEALGSDAPLYDLSGRRVLNPTKGGIYIKNGHKFVQQ